MCLWYTKIWGGGGGGGGMYSRKLLVFTLCSFYTLHNNTSSEDVKERKMQQGASEASPLLLNIALGFLSPICLCGADEELGAIGVGASIGHAQDTRPSVLQLEVLIRELASIYGLATSSIATSEVTSLHRDGGREGGREGGEGKSKGY